MRDEFTSFAQLSAATVEGRDWEIQYSVRESSIVLVAPHGGTIEPHTDEIARAIAASDLSYYCFRSLSSQLNLHLTSHLFDEPRCIDIVSRHDVVITVHGWDASGCRGCAGGRNHRLCAEIINRLAEAGLNFVPAVGGLTGLNPMNIANRGRTGAGVQLELSMSFRRDPKSVATLTSLLREILLANSKN